MITISIKVPIKTNYGEWVVTRNYDVYKNGNVHEYGDECERNMNSEEMINTITNLVRYGIGTNK